MAIELGPLLELVAELADELEAEYGPDVELAVGMVAVELVDVDGRGIVEHRSTQHSTAHALGLLELAAMSLRAGYARADPDEDE